METCFKYGTRHERNRSTCPWDIDAPLQKYKCGPPLARTLVRGWVSGWVVGWLGGWVRGWVGGGEKEGAQSAISF